MASWQAANQGAQVGAQTGNPWVTVGLAALAGLMGKKPSWTGPQRQQMRIADQMEAMGNAAPLSRPDEAAGLASQLALLNQAAGGMQSRFAAAAGPQSGLTPEARADMLRNLMSSQLQTQGDARMQALLASFGRKQQALMGAAQIAGSVGAKGEPGGNQFPELLGQFAYLNAIRKGGGQPLPGGGPGPGLGATMTTPQVGGRAVGPGGIGAGYVTPLPTVTGQGGALHPARAGLSALFGAPAQSPMLPSTMGMGLQTEGPVPLGGWGWNRQQQQQGNPLAMLRRLQGQR